MIRYKCVKYNDLSIDDLYAIMVLRQEVFIVEQDCPYLDADGRDSFSMHVMGLDDGGKLIAYARISPSGISYEGYTSIGRVVVAKSARSTKEGYKLMEASLKFCDVLYPNISNKISAQEHLQRFYGNLGYLPSGESYLEDNIPHIAMIRS